MTDYHYFRMIDGVAKCHGCGMLFANYNPSDDYACQPSDPKPDEPVGKWREDERCTCEDQPRYCDFCIKKVEAWQERRSIVYAMERDTIAAKNVSAIYAIQPQCHIPPKPVEQKPVDPRAAQIQKAVSRICNEDIRDAYRLGCGLVEE
jgi:hypothetical protein